MLLNSNKNRLIEVYNYVNNTNINEALLDKPTKEGIIKDFLKYCNSYLGLNNNLPKIVLNYDEDYGRNNKSFASYDFYNNVLTVSLSNRNLADVLRSMAHELVHHKQNIDGRIKSSDDGKSGSEIENEANSVAGVILRLYGKENPIIYE